MKVKHFITVGYVLIITVVFFVDYFEPIKYLKYWSLAMAIILFISYKKLRIVIPDFLYPFIILHISFIIKPFQYNMQGLMEMLFQLAAMGLFFIPSMLNIKIDIRILSGLSMLLLTFLYIPTANIDLSLSAFFRSETSNIEGGISFFFGLFSLYFFLEKKYMWMLANIIFMILSLKRIVFLGFILVVIIYYLPTRVKNIILNKWFIIGANLFYIFIIYGMSTGIFDELIRELTGLSPGWLTQGRTTLISLILSYIEPIKGKVFMYGLGMGTTYPLTSFLLGHVMLLHNDVIKILLEHGIFIFILFFYFLHNLKDEKRRLMALLLNLFFLTDNSLIYATVLLLYFTIQNNFTIERRGK